MTFRKENAAVFYEIRNLKTAKKILMLIDGYRKFNVEDFEWADREVKEKKMGLRFIMDWRKIREIMFKFAREAGSQKHLLKLAALQQLFIQFGLIITAVTTLLAALVAFSSFFRFEWTGIISQVFSYMLVPLIIGILITFIGPPFIGRKISIELEQYYRKKSEFVKEADKLLASVAQNIIYSIAECIRTGKVEAKNKKDYEVWLFNSDYNGIRVMKKPFLFRKYYVATLNI